METVASCFILSVIYLSCDINPLLIGSYPNVEYVTFIHSGSEESPPSSLFYRFEDWPNLKFVNTGVHLYTCNKSGRCLLHDTTVINDDPLDYTWSPNGQIVNPTDKSSAIKPRSRALDPSTPRPSSEGNQHFSEGQLLNVIMSSSTRGPNDNHDKPNPIKPESGPQEPPSARSSAEGISRQSERELLTMTGSSTIKPTFEPKLSITISPTSFRQLFVNTFNETVRGIKNNVKELMKKELKKQLDYIKELIIGFSSSFISITTVGGSIVIGVKLYKRRAQALAIPPHLYLPFHTPPTVGVQIQEDSDEDIDVFDIQNQSRGRKKLSPTAPLKEQTPQQECSSRNETVVKELFCGPDHAKTSKKTMKSSKKKHRRSQSDECLALEHYNLRSRKDKNAMSTEL